MRKISLAIFSGFLFLLPSYVWGQIRPVKFGQQSEFKPGAYIHFRGSYTEDDKGDPDATPPRPAIDMPDTLDIVRARVYLDGKIMRDISVRFEYELCDATDKLLDAYVEMSHFPYADWTIRLGQFKLPLSEAGLALSTPIQETIKGPLIYEGGDTTFSDREFGILVQGEMLEKKGIYVLGVVNGNGINQSDDNDMKDRFFQFQVSPWKEDTRSKLKPLQFSAAYMEGEVSEEGTIGVDHRERYAFTMKYEVEGATITYEYFNQIRDLDGPDDITTKAWYVQLSRPYEANFLKKRQKIQTIARYEFYDPDNRLEKDEIRAWTIGGNWQINKALRLQLNYNIFTEDKDVKTDNDEALLQLELRF